MYNSIYEILERTNQIYGNRKQISVCQELREVGARNVKEDHEGNLGFVEMSSNLIVVVGPWSQTYVKTH